MALDLSATTRTEITRNGPTDRQPAAEYIARLAPGSLRRPARGPQVKRESGLSRTPTTVGASSAAAAGDGRNEIVRDGLFTVTEAVAFLRLSRSTLYTLMDGGELVYVRIGRARRIPRRALIDLAAAHLNGDSSG